VEKRSTIKPRMITAVTIIRLVDAEIVMRGREMGGRDGR
jgi:hypothetical protein